MGGLRDSLRGRVTVSGSGSGSDAGEWRGWQVSV
jgi:hypothetical protein